MMDTTINLRRMRRSLSKVSSLSPRQTRSCPLRKLTDKSCEVSIMLSGEKSRTESNRIFHRRIGHNCVWYNQLPSWVNSLSGSALSSAMVNHCTTLLTHFKNETCTSGEIPLVNQSSSFSGLFFFRLLRYHKRAIQR